jgi:hypothetical protein
MKPPRDVPQTATRSAAVYPDEQVEYLGGLLVEAGHEVIAFLQARPPAVQSRRLAGLRVLAVTGHVE